MTDENFVKNFPYKPEPFSLALLGGTLRKPDGTSVKTSDLVGDKDVLALYFSAHWCPPCRGFTPTLCEKYTTLKEAGKSFEMVFVSSDRDEAAFTEYADSMTFPALPFAERDAKAKLSKIFKVNGIPSLCFVNAKTGQLITDEGRAGVTSEDFVKDFPYHPKPVNDLGSTTSGINDSVALIVLCESADKATQDEITEMLTPIAEAELAKPESEQTVSKFFTGKGGGPLDRIRSMFGLDKVDGAGPCMIIIDLDDSGAFYPCPENLSEVTKENVLALMKRLKDGTLKRMNLG